MQRSELLELDGEGTGVAENTDEEGRLPSRKPQSCKHRLDATDGDVAESHKMARACLEDSVCARETPQLGRTAVEHRGEVPSTHVVAAADGNDCGEGWLAWWEEDVQELTVRALALPQHRLTAPVAAGSAVAASAEPHLLPQQWTLSPPRLLTQRSGSIASCLQRQWSTPQVKVEQQPGSPVGVLVGSAQLLSQQPLTPRAPQRKIQPFRLSPGVWVLAGGRMLHASSPPDCPQQQPSISCLQ